ncbi:MAG: hypothetical protein IH950_09295 [Bacteroidetes bacterium]|nr:hypothetical protein [Bacteroidota bacterium]
MDIQKFAKQFTDFITTNGNDPQNWYVGIASNAEERLQDGHGIIQGDIFIFDNALTEQNARAVEKYLIESHDTQGNPGGGDSETTWVYAYKINGHTRE